MNNYFSNKFWAKSSWRNGSRQLVEFWDSSWEEIPTCDHQHQCEKVLVPYLWIRTFKEEQEDRIHHCPDRNAFGPWLRGWIGHFWGRREDWRFCDLDHFKPWTLNHWQLFLMTWASKEGFSDLCDDPHRSPVANLHILIFAKPSKSIFATKMYCHFESHPGDSFREIRCVNKFSPLRRYFLLFLKEKI